MAFVEDRFVARHADGTPSNGREPLDVEAMFRELTSDDRLDEPMPPGTRLGHVHLYVANLDTTMRFYHGLLGFDNMGIDHSIRMGMASIAGYHHNIGFNTWLGEGAPPPPPEALGLRYFTVVLPNQVELEHIVERIQQAGVGIEPTEDGVLVRDPSQNGVMLASLPGSLA